MENEQPQTPTKKPKVNLSFKKQPRSTGLMSVGEGFTVSIKINKKRVGTFSGGHWNSEGKVTIQIAFKKEDSWAWKFLKNECKTEDDARSFIKSIAHKLKVEELHFFDTEF